MPLNTFINHPVTPWVAVAVVTVAAIVDAVGDVEAVVDAAIIPVAAAETVEDAAGDPRWRVAADFAAADQETENNTNNLKK